MSSGRAFLAAGVVAVLAAVSCGPLGEEKEGSGIEASETRELGRFNSIELSSEADTVITVGEPQRVVVRGDDNLLQDVETEVDEGRLEIGQSDNVDLTPEVDLTVEVSVPQLEAVELSGAGDIKVIGLRGGSFRVDLSGAGNVEASGDVERVEAELSGAGDVRLAELVARDAVADLSGAGSINVHATESLSASVSGAGDVVYTGDPDDVEREVSGAGEIRPG